MKKLSSHIFLLVFEGLLLLLLLVLVVVLIVLSNDDVGVARGTSFQGDMAGSWSFKTDDFVEE